MRFLPAALFSLSFLSCAPAPPAKELPVPKPSENQPVAEIASEQVFPVEAPRFTRGDRTGVTFEGVAFDSRTHRLAVIDQPDGPGTRFANAATAGNSISGITAVNAGFFTPEGQPLGLVVSAGKISGSWNSASSLGSGIWFADTSGKTAISRRGKMGRTAAAASRELIQAGPLLIENGAAVSGLEATKSSARIVLLWDGGSRWWIGRGSPCTLADLSNGLASQSPAGWKIRHALNLDGGRSADLWVSSSVSGGPFLSRPPWNRPVRNFLVLLQK